ncbi:MAG: PorT family protein [Bacteroidales bacterium]|nr:PorT family protein [Bacteroidales bacterium]
MKKGLFLLTGILFLFTMVMAQSGRIGFYGGTNFSGINGNYSAYGYQTTVIKDMNRMQMGLILSIPLSERLSLYLDPGYFEKGFNFNEDKDLDVNVAYSGSQRFNYIHLPFTIKLGLTKNQLFYLRSGFYYAFLLSSQVKSDITYSYPDEIISESSDEKNTDKMNKTVLGLVTAVGMDVPLSEKISIILDLSYNLDLTNPMKDNYPQYWWNKSDYYFNNVNVRNSVFTISAGLTFKI